MNSVYMPSTVAAPLKASLA